MENTPLHRTPLFDLHLELGGKMVPFAGYEMPVQYKDGILKEHLHTRASAGLFDVSHMGQVMLRGEGAAWLESLVPTDIQGLAAGQQRYTVLTNQDGGAIDDLMVANLGDALFLVINAGCKDKDIAHLRAHLPAGLSLEVQSDRALLALQGPAAAAVMARLAPAASALKFMQVAAMDVNGAACIVSRSGYTGEDGFEISVPADQARTLAEALLAQAEVAPVGLGARDSLRLEAGLCLYGHELDESVSPIEAGLNWIMAKVRRPGGERAGGYPGAARIERELSEGPSRRRVGLKAIGRAPVRDGAELQTLEGDAVGYVTSGGFGPTVNGPIAIAYVTPAHAAPGTRLNALVRGKPQEMEVVAMPFVAQRYYRG